MSPSPSIVRMSTSIILFLCLLVISHSHFKVVMAQTTKPPLTDPPATIAPTTEAPTTPVPTTEAPTTEAPTTEAPTTEAPTTTPPPPPVTSSPPTTSSPTNKTTTTPIINNDKSDGVSFSTVALIILIPIGCFLVLCYCYSKRGSQTTQTAASSSSTFGRPQRSGPRHTRYEDLDLELGNGMVNDPDEETQDGTRTATHDPHRGAAPATRPQFTLSAFSDNEQDLADTDIDYAGVGAVAVSEEPAPKKKKKVVKKRVETNDNEEEEETTKPVQTSSVIPTLEPPPEAPKKKKKKRATPTPSPNQAIDDDEA